jgi:ornithine decarboxylase
LKQVTLWRQHLPLVQPFYAVKSNPSPVLLKWMRPLGLKVDCASPGEMRAVLDAGFQPSDILYANTMKAATDLRDAFALGVRQTTTDSVEGVEQLANEKTDCSVLVRLAVDDRGARSPFSIKFGAVQEEWKGIMEAIRSTGLTFGGVSFHVGSNSSDPMAFPNAIRLCRLFQERIGCDVPLVDMGGGFLPSESIFRQTAAAIRQEMEDWPHPRQWIAEPGRFFSAPVQMMLCPIVFKKVGKDRIRYLLDDSVYGQFSSIVFDHAKPAWRVLGAKGACTGKQALFFGKTCDSLDLIASEENAAEYQVGDVFVIPNMGAYTSASATTFNGFPVPPTYYLEDERFCTTKNALEALFEEVPVTTGVSFPIETKSNISLSL